MAAGRDGAGRDAAGRERARRELDETVLAFRVARRASVEVNGWVRTVRQAVGLPLKELARRLGVREREVCRMERSEQAGRIGIWKLREAAAALGCDLVYALVPREGTLEGMAAARAEAREAERAEARVRARQKRREQARQKRPTARNLARQEPGYRSAMRRALRKALRAEGIRLR